MLHSSHAYNFNLFCQNGEANASSGEYKRYLLTPGDYEEALIGQCVYSTNCVQVFSSVQYKLCKGVQ